MLEMAGAAGTSCGAHAAQRNCAQRRLTDGAERMQAANVKHFTHSPTKGAMIASVSVHDLGASHKAAEIDALWRPAKTDGKDKSAR
jgi:hypothetical protein